MFNQINFKNLNIGKHFTYNDLTYIKCICDGCCVGQSIIDGGLINIDGDDLVTPVSITVSSR